MFVKVETRRLRNLITTMQTTQAEVYFLCSIHFLYLSTPYFLCFLFRQISAAAAAIKIAALDTAVEETQARLLQSELLLEESSRHVTLLETQLAQSQVSLFFINVLLSITAVACVEQC